MKWSQRGGGGGGGGGETFAKPGTTEALNTVNTVHTPPHPALPDLQLTEYSKIKTTIQYKPWHRESRIDATTGKQRQRQRRGTREMISNTFKSGNYTPSYGRGKFR